MVNASRTEEVVREFAYGRDPSKEPARIVFIGHAGNTYLPEGWDREE